MDPNIKNCSNLINEFLSDHRDLTTLSNHRSIELILQLPNVESILASNEMREKIAAIKAQGSTSYLNVLELLVSLGRRNVSLIQVLHSSGYLPDLLSMVKKSRDPLVQMNCLVLLSQFGSTPESATYLHQQGLFQYLCDSLVDFNEDGNFKTRLLAVLGRYLPEVLDQEFPKMIDSLIDFVDQSQNVSQKAEIIFTIAQIALTTQGKKIVAKRPNFSTVIKEISKFLQISGRNEDRAQIILSLRDLFTVQDDHSKNDGEAITQNWFKILSEETNVNEALASLSHLDDAQSEVFELMKEMTRHSWGIRAIANEATLKFLLDRTRTYPMEVQIKRFDVVEKILQSPFAPTYFTGRDMETIKDFHDKGPFGRVESGTAIADNTV